MENFTKVVRIGTVMVGTFTADLFCKVAWDGSRLSMTGVEGPTKDGNAIGGCGQLSRPEKVAKFAKGWDEEKMSMFFAVWHKWHLNDMRASCEHQREAGWDEKATKRISLFHWRLADSVEEGVRNDRKDAMDALLRGETVTLDPETLRLLGLPGRLVTCTKDISAPEYVPCRTTPHEETRYCGQTYEKEHPEGILDKVCETCGYRYGSAWLAEEVPVDVLAFLKGLPDADRAPAWV